MLWTTLMSMFAMLTVARKVEGRQSLAIMAAPSDTFLDQFLELEATPSITKAVGPPLSVPAPTATDEDTSPPVITDSDEVEATSPAEPSTSTAPHSTVTEKTTAAPPVVTKPTSITVDEHPDATSSDRGAPPPTSTAEPDVTKTLTLDTITTHDTSTIISALPSTVTFVTSYTIPPTTTTITPTSTATPVKSGGGLSTGAKAGIGGGLGGLAILLGVLGWIYYTRKQEEKERNRERTPSELAMDHYNGKNIFHPQRHAAHHGEPTVPTVSGEPGFDGKSELPGNARYHPEQSRRVWGAAAAAAAAAGPSRQ